MLVGTNGAPLSAEKKSLLIAIAVPNRDDFKGETVSSLVRLTWDICNAGHRPMYLSSHSCFIDKARNLLWDEAKAHGCDYLLFVDSDVAVANAIEDNIVKRLLELDKDVVVGLYVDKRPPHRLHIYNFTADGLLINIPEWDEENPFKIDAGPTGFMLISKKVMDAFTPNVEQRIGKPFSYLDYGLPTELGEDVSFCKRVSQLKFEVWADPFIKLGHFGKDVFTTEHYKMMKEFAAQRFDNNIEGWMSPLELEFLNVLARKNKRIVEVGSWKGRSTKALLDSGNKVYAVDTWEGSQDPNDLTFQQAKQSDIFEEFKKNVGSYDNLKIVRKTSLSAAKEFNDKSVDMVFIDANHTYEEVKKDIEAWLPKAKQCICGHDYIDTWPGVQKAVREIFKDQFRVVGSIWYVELGTVRNA